MFFYAMAIGLCSTTHAAQDIGEQLRNLPIPSDFKRLKTGLWEDTIETDTPSMSPEMLNAASQVDTSRLSAQERARVEAAIKKQQQKLKDQGPTTTTTKRNCMTPEKLQKPAGFENSGNDRYAQSCVLTVLNSSSSRLSFKTSCDMGNMDMEVMKNAPAALKGGGRMSVTYDFEVKSPELVVTQMSSEGNMGSTPMKSRSTTTSRWVAASCGSVK